MSVTIPGALADHLAAERPFDLETRATLDDARRGRGRTLVIEPKTIAPLHVISRRAEYLLGNAYATRPQKEAARVWLKRAGHAPQIITTRYTSTEEAYDASQCSEDTRAGDVLVVEAEQAVAFLWQAWPTAVTTAHGEFHRAEGDPRKIEANTGPSVRAAMDAAYAIGAPLARDEDQLEAKQALEQAAADDAPEAHPTLEAALAEQALESDQPAALPAGVRCIIHGDACDNDAKRRHEFRIAPTAAEQPVVIIPCGAAKLDHAAPAAELYTGSYHRACARAAAALTANGGTVVILSALHGLVPLDRVLAPYEMRMGSTGSVTADVLREQARELGLDRAADVTILAGLSYTAPALAVWPHASTPLAGLAGMGHHMQALAAIAAGEQQPTEEQGDALYAPHGLRNLTTGHMRDDTTGRAYCGAQLAGPNGAAVLTCAACRHIRDTAVAVAVVEADEQFAAVTRAVDAVTYAEETGAGVATVTDAEALFAAQLVTEADADAGTWRGEWIGEQPDDGLFALAPNVEQGALFTGRATAPTAAEAAPPAAGPYCSPEVTRTSVDAYLARTYPALLALRDSAGEPPF
ncbi:hypothetical protein OOK39_21865 [Streptomyces sp. NBC_00264]|uniref:DUF6884 domain-containing protein n=2 Tax=Streptomyces TaxID=1883 RepID=UPI002254FA96|nr:MULTISPECIES: DUF6884 domain-containing protein [unclassified Streptomyces]MCX5161892.1 hypothetical protein [Streptomyces sp. NBC_00305]MCX5220409.1 hypothetical protein [Streptomyces sp. NBC_00264]